MLESKNESVTEGCASTLQKRGARKSKARKTVPLFIRIDEISHAKLTDSADAAGMTKSVWIEQAVIANKTVIAPQERPGLNALLFQVCRAGNNLNQLARSFNVLLLMERITQEDVANAIVKLEEIDALLNEAIAYAR